MPTAAVANSKTVNDFLFTFHLVNAAVFNRISIRTAVTSSSIKIQASLDLSNSTFADGKLEITIQQQQQLEREKKTEKNQYLNGTIKLLFAISFLHNNNRNTLCGFSAPFFLPFLQCAQHKKARYQFCNDTNRFLQ